MENLLTDGKGGATIIDFDRARLLSHIPDKKRARELELDELREAMQGKYTEWIGVSPALGGHHPASFPNSNSPWESS